jgi:hypothetical protein
MYDYRRGSDWWMDLLTTYTHNSKLQAITASPLISTIHRSPQHPLSIFQPAVSPPAAPRQRLLTGEILQLHGLKFYLHSRRAELMSTVNSTTAPSLLSLPCKALLTDCQSQSQSYFKPGGLPPITSSWLHDPLDPRPQFLFSNWAVATSSLTRGWVCRLQLLLDLASAVDWLPQFSTCYNTSARTA